MPPPTPRAIRVDQHGRQLLSGPQKARVARAYGAAGADAVAGYRKVLAELLNEEERAAVLRAVERS